MHLTAVWTEMSSWRHSAASYASAIGLWGTASRAANTPPWPPDSKALHVLITACRSAVTLEHYISHVRSALRLVRADLGTLSDTKCLVLGAVKAKADGPKRYKARATAEQTKKLAKWCRIEDERPDVAETFIVARQFGLRRARKHMYAHRHPHDPRYGSEIVHLNEPGHSIVHLDAEGGVPKIGVTLSKRKWCRTPQEARAD